MTSTHSVPKPSTATPVPGSSRPTVLAVATEWSSAHGGLSTFNRRLCVALAASGASVACLVSTATESEIEDAGARGVRLVIRHRTSGGSGHAAVVGNPAHSCSRPDLVIGHGRVTGAEAEALVRENYPFAARLHFVHVIPDELEWWRPGRDDDPGERAEQRTLTELRLCRGADAVVAVGPRLQQILLRDLAAVDGAPGPRRFDPGFDLASTRVRVPPPGAPAQILLMGRLADYEIKGVDLAVRSLAHALVLRGRDEEVELLVRGVPPGEAGAFRNQVLSWAGDTGMRVTVRPFTTNADSLRQDLMRATLMLMPSRAESFGLVGVEAMVSGTPVLVSSRSGLGMLLGESLGSEDAARLVVPVRLREREDVQRWGYRIASVLDDPAAAFASVDAARRRMAALHTWESAARDLLSGYGGIRPHLVSYPSDRPVLTP